MANPINIQKPPPTGNLPSVDSSQLGQGVPGPPQRVAPQIGHVAAMVARCGTNEVPPPLFAGAVGGGEALNP